MTEESTNLPIQLWNIIDVSGQPTKVMAQFCNFTTNGYAMFIIDDQIVDVLWQPRRITPEKVLGSS